MEFDWDEAADRADAMGPYQRGGISGDLKSIQKQLAREVEEERRRDRDLARRKNDLFELANWLNEVEAHYGHNETLACRQLREFGQKYFRSLRPGRFQELEWKQLSHDVEKSLSAWMEFAEQHWPEMSDVIASAAEAEQRERAAQQRRMQEAQWERKREVKEKAVIRGMLAALIALVMVGSVIIFADWRSERIVAARLEHEEWVKRRFKVGSTYNVHLKDGRELTGFTLKEFWDGKAISEQGDWFNLKEYSANLVIPGQPEK